MKTKRQDYRSWRRTTPIGRLQDLAFAVFGRAPKQYLELLETDAQMQAARFAQLQEAILLPLRVPEPVLVPAVDDGPLVEMPETQEPPTAFDSYIVPYTPDVIDGSAATSQTTESPQVLSEGEQVQLAVASDPRQKYGSMVNSSRVRRRVML